MIQIMFHHYYFVFSNNTTAKRLVNRSHKSYQLHETRGSSKNSETMSEGTLDEGEVTEENAEMNVLVLKNQYLR